MRLFDGDKNACNLLCTAIALGHQLTDEENENARFVLDEPDVVPAAQDDDYSHFHLARCIIL